MGKCTKDVNVQSSPLMMSVGLQTMTFQKARRSRVNGRAVQTDGHYESAASQPIHAGDEASSCNRAGEAAQSASVISGKIVQKISEISESCKPSNDELSLEADLEQRVRDHN